MFWKVAYFLKNISVLEWAYEREGIETEMGETNQNSLSVFVFKFENLVIDSTVRNVIFRCPSQKQIGSNPM